MKMLIFNVGSATVKYAVYQDGRLERKIIHTSPSLKIIKQILNKNKGVDYIVHRIVHGYGLKSGFINKQVIKDIEKTIELNLAPLHNPKELAVIKYCQRLNHKYKQIAIFDNDFYNSMPKEATTYAIPSNITKKYKIKKYGFHGINHNYIVKQVAKHLGKPKNKVNIISLHLGSGSSITAIAKGKPIDTTMGFTPLDGVMMRTRSGAIDPMIPLLIGIDNKTIEILNEKSGMLALTGKQDFRHIVNNLDNVKCKFAFNLFVRQIIKAVSSYYGLLRSRNEKPDGIVFSAGIGQNCWQLRSSVCKKLKWLGVNINEKTNKKIDEDYKWDYAVISKPSSKIKIMVIHQNEEAEMTKIAKKLIKKRMKNERGENNN